MSGDLKDLAKKLQALPDFRWRKHVPTASQPLEQIDGWAL